MATKILNLLPQPRSLKFQRGFFAVPKRGVLSVATLSRTNSAPDHPEGYTLSIHKNGVEIRYRDIGGRRAALTTLKQIQRECGSPLPCIEIRDWPDFPRRGVMLDVSRGRVPKLSTLLELVEHLADFKINELQLYTEHTFAYRRYKTVWRNCGALTGREIRKLDTRCRELGIDLVPNQNSFGHLRHFLEHPKLRKLAEVSEPYEDDSGEFVRHPTTLAPNHPGSIRFLRELYDELLPNFSSRFFNVGCDETWDLGRGHSKVLCQTRGKGRVYLDFLKKIHREVSRRGRRMMFWGDIILKYPRLVRELPKNVIALNWGYEADHPFAKETARFARAGVPFYVCPGTSTWMSLVGRHDNALANLRAFAAAGRRRGAIGYLITDWGDGGHPQPLAVSYLPYAAGAALSWCADTFSPRLLVPVLNRDIFHDPAGRAAEAALALGLAHRKLHYTEPNLTPLGAVIAAPPPTQRELYCRHGLIYYKRISPTHIRAARREIDRQRAVLRQSRPRGADSKLLVAELDLAARMALASCDFMLWQQAVAGANRSAARTLATRGIEELRKLDRDFAAYWPRRNKPSRPGRVFLTWRLEDYRRAVAIGAAARVGPRSGAGRFP